MKNFFYDSLIGTVAHEYFHSVRFEYYPSHSESLIDILVGEGLAENFKDNFCKKVSPWTQSIAREESKRIFIEISDKLSENNPDFYRELFFNDGKYPLWAGYSIGYNLVKDFLSQQDSINWNFIAHLSSEDIAKQSKWL